VRAYCWLLAAYGVGNLAGALVLSNVSMVHPMRVMGWGFALLGGGFFLMTLSSSIPWMMLGLAISAVGGPMNDLAHIDVIQRRYEPHDLVRVVRFRMAVEYGGILFSLLLAPTLFRLAAPEHVIQLAGFGIFVVGMIALARYAEKSPVQEMKPEEAQLAVRKLSAGRQSH
jgi:hypothetical protein